MLSFTSFDRITTHIFHSTPSISTDGPSELSTTHHHDLVAPNVLLHHVSSCDQSTSYDPCLQILLTVDADRLTINILPDDVLLLVFRFDREIYLNELDTFDQLHPSWKWYRLVHVCRRWRFVGFASPNFLDLKLVCGPSTRVELTGIWPPLPIALRNTIYCPMPGDYNFDAVIVHHNRVSEIGLHLTHSQLRRLASAMLKQFPALMHLSLCFKRTDRHTVPALPDEFLGGSVPRLQSLELDSIIFPALPRLLLSATNLVRLRLLNIPRYRHMLKALVTSLGVLANLEYIDIGFKSPSYSAYQENRRPPPPTRIVLPALTSLNFKGSSKLLEDLVALIDAPLLHFFTITFFPQPIYDTPRLAQFMRHATMFKALNEVHVDIYPKGIRVGSSFSPTLDGRFGLSISCGDFFWRHSSTAIYTSLLATIYTAEHLYIYWPRHSPPPYWKEGVDEFHWLEVFRPFTAVKNLYVSKGLEQCIAFALEELVEEKRTDLLPALESLFFEEHVSGLSKEAIGQFLATRRLLGHTVTVSRWEEVGETVFR